MLRTLRKRRIAWPIIVAVVLALVGCSSGRQADTEPPSAPAEASRGGTVLQYLQTSGPVVNRIGDCDKAILALVELALSDHSQVSDSSWKERIATRHQEVTRLTGELTDIHAPDLCQKYQDTMIKIVTIMSDATTKLENAKEQFEVDEAAADLAKKNPLLDQASSQLDEMNAAGMKG